MNSMRFDKALKAMLLVCVAAMPIVSCASARPPELIRHDMGAEVRLAPGRTVRLQMKGHHVQVIEEGRVTQLSELDFRDTHVLSADLNGDGISELLVELHPSRSGSCYELWSPQAETYVRHEDLFCNPGVDSSGALVTVERDGAYSYVREYATGASETLEWVRRQEPLTPDFGRLVTRADDGSAAEMVIFLGLPECGEAQLEFVHPVDVSDRPATAPTKRLTGTVLVVDVARDSDTGVEWIRVQDLNGGTAWLASSDLGNIEDAAHRRCKGAQ